MGGECGAFFSGQRYPKAGKRGQLLSKGGTVRRRVEEVLWSTSLEDFETSVTVPGEASVTFRGSSWLFCW